MEPGCFEFVDRETQCLSTVRPEDILDQKGGHTLWPVLQLPTLRGWGWRGPSGKLGETALEPCGQGVQLEGPIWLGCVFACCGLHVPSWISVMGELTAPSTLLGRPPGRPPPHFPCLTCRTVGPAPLWTWAWTQAAVQPAPPPLPTCGQWVCCRQPWAVACVPHLDIMPRGCQLGGLLAAEARQPPLCCSPGQRGCREEALS